MIEVLEYITDDGRSPYQEWLDGLDRGIRGRIRVRIDRVILGNFGDNKSVGEGVNELRMHFGSGYRVYFGKDGHKVVILLCGGDKSSQVSDISRAQAYWLAYRSEKSPKER